MTYEIERKIINKMDLTENEVSEFLKFLCNMIRDDNQIIDPFDSNCKLCYRTSEQFGRVALMKFNCDVEILNIKNLLQIPLTHYANIITFNVNGKTKTYLVDLTYSQFFGKSITLDDNKKILTRNFFGKIENEDFVKNLRQCGYVELNVEILKKYIDCFLEICNGNKDIAYSNLEQLLTKNRIKINLKK